jgi:cell growth-regulating nucleolar protein
MVYFNCAKCGTGMKKQQVAQHLQYCRTDSVSCNDCNTDFYGTTYAQHVKCISEAEKYESKSYQPKANKGELKQSAWVEVCIVYACCV